jgi:hypothetical protein
MAKKMTIKEMLEKIAENPTLTAEQKEFLLERAEKSVKKVSADRKPTKTQLANDELRAEIFESMESGVKYTVSDMIKKIGCCAELSNQKVTAVIKPLIDNGITKVVEGRKTYFVKG